ncbi:alpha/beta fold hydrolase [Ensifer sp. LC163]|uniref:alpha/beta fold hydrolase n=1 Tax=Ensifer sp. LC163 TaxID=1120652 RepID=UPI000812E5BB|nr:alpha/beta hydrolase [Ensifer sp. LC163]OCP38561.1 hypothetical protein BC360_00320 [Ensifer sp. LC163]
MRRALGILTALVLGVSGGLGWSAEPALKDPPPVVDASPHSSNFIEANGIRLNYLDWGDNGPPVVMIHGIGDDPHIFDDLANSLKGRFHLIAYARRGHGHSDAPAGPYDHTALVADLKGLLDALAIEKASLIGWSLGGNEITEFAGTYPDRVDKLVYLESGYDWSYPAFLNAFVDMLAVNAPAASDVASIDAFRDWYHAAWLGSDTPWSNGMEAYLRDLLRIAPDNSIRVVPSDATYGAILAEMAKWYRDYEKVKAPALVFYASSFFPVDRSDPAPSAKLKAFNEEVVAPFRATSMERVSSELKRATIKQFPNTTHMGIGIHDPEPLAKDIAAFLSAAH